MNSAVLKWLKIALGGSAFVFLTFWYFSFYWNHDLVWDELVSLTNFILTDLHTTVTVYPDVNNHIFFSFIYNIYCKLLSVPTIYDAMDHTPAVRILSFGFSLVAVIYTFLVGKRFFSFETGVAAAVILVTTIPYLNFAVQLRGYSISTTFFIMLLYHALSYRENSKNLHLLLTAVLTVCLLYTIPSNIYFGLCMGLSMMYPWFLEGRKLSNEAKNQTKKHLRPSTTALWIKNNTYFKILTALGIGAVLAYLAYQPVLELIMNERHLQEMKGQSHHLYNLQDALPHVYLHFLSFRFLLLIPVLVSFPVVIKKLKPAQWNEIDRKVFLLVALALLPFILGFIRGDKPPQRTFTPLAPIFALIIAFLTTRLFPMLKDKPWKAVMAQLGLLIYCVATFFFCRHHINAQLNKAIKDGDMVFNSFYNFYQSDDFGFKYLDPLISAAKETGYPIIMAREIDRVAEGEYLHKHDLKYFSTVWAKPAPDPNGKGSQLQVLFEISQGKGEKPGYSRVAFPGTIPEDAGKLVPLYYFLAQNRVINEENPAFYVLTFAPRWFESTMQQLPHLKAEKITPGLSYHNTYLVTKR